MTQPYRIIDLSPFTLPLKGTELIEISDGGNGSFKLQFASALPGTAYYVSPTGNDGAGGTSPGTALQTIAKVNSLSLQPGDSVLFQGGQTFSGAIVCPTAGTPANPITFGSYGGGQATISSGTSTGFSSTNQAGIIVRDLIFSGSPAASQRGIYFLNNSAGNIHFQNIRVMNCTVSGYGVDGIAVLGNNGSAGYDDVLIEGCTVSSCCSFPSYPNAGHGTCGIYVYSPAGFGLVNFAVSFNNVTINNCYVSGCLGTSDTNWTASGIVIAETNLGTISNCEANGNGGSSNSSKGNGPAGIWCYDSTKIVITSCRAINQASGNGADGDGFDIDIGCTDCEINNCYSEGNHGAGFLLYSDNSAGVTANTGSRYVNCTSYNDATGGSGKGGFIIGNQSGTLTNFAIMQSSTYVATAGAAALLLTGTSISAATGHLAHVTLSVSLNQGIISGSIPSGVTYTGLMQYNYNQSPTILSNVGSAGSVTGSDYQVFLNNVAAGAKSWTFLASGTGSPWGAGNALFYDFTDTLAVWFFNSTNQTFSFSVGETIGFASDINALLTDTGISRSSASTLCFGNGTHLDTTAELKGGFFVAQYTTGGGPGFFAQLVGDSNSRATLALTAGSGDVGYLSLGPGNAGADIFLNRASAGAFGVGTANNNNLGTMFAANFTASATATASVFKTSTALVATGGGGGNPALAASSTGGTGQPTTAAQNAWVKAQDSTGATIWIPVWK